MICFEVLYSLVHAEAIAGGVSPVALRLCVLLYALTFPVALRRWRAACDFTDNP